ncbi:MAG: hypothetical protein M3082_20785 [Candidatus Dormibacteraeota bacterium]|nr:hypothetical protein [Candidatus Dormibacteraeota bacterium]
MDKSDEKKPLDPKHEGSFAEGVEDIEKHPEDSNKGDFAKGQEKDPASHEHRHEGSFATGEEVVEHHPETRSKGDFAKGQEDVEEDDRP